MVSSWEKFEELIKSKMRTVYSEAVVEHSMNPRNLGEGGDANGFGRITGPCGDTMSTWLKVDHDAIVGAGFITDGCGTTFASGSMVTEMAKGKSVAEAQKISQQDILNALGGLPDENEHCALLAENTLKEAIKDYLNSKKRGPSQARFCSRNRRFIALSEARQGESN
jgi:nitrogen fixation NifU-like protein